jgi:DNA-binding NtrC family response regulator
VRCLLQPAHAHLRAAALSSTTVVTPHPAAYARIADKRPECIVTDLQMPGMNGLELLEQIRKIDAELPVVFITAFGSVETAVEAMKKGALDYVTKPFSGDELAISAERALERRRDTRRHRIRTRPRQRSADADRREIDLR